jgi:hypothetical protein
LCAGCASFQPIPGPGRDGGLYRYTVDYHQEYLPFALPGKAIMYADKSEGFHINCCAMAVGLFPGVPLYAAEQFVICPLVDTALIPYDLGLKLWERHVCAHKGLKVVLIDGAGRPVEGCEIKVIVDALDGYRIVYGGKPCPRGYYSASVTTDGNGEAYIPIDMGTCWDVRLEGWALTTNGKEEFHTQVDGGHYWRGDSLHRWDDTGEKNRVVLNLKGTIEREDSAADEVAAWKVASFAVGDLAEAGTPPVPEGVRGVVLPVGKGRREVRSARGGAASVGVGMEPSRAETVVWNGAGRELWSGRTKWKAPEPVFKQGGGVQVWNGGDVAVPVRPLAGVLAWNGADVAVKPKGWKKDAEVEVFAWTLEGYGKELAQKAGEAFGSGTPAARFNAEADGGWQVIRWNAWPDAPGTLRLYVFAVKEDADGDGLDDGREVVEWRTFPDRCDTDGDTRGDGLEVFLGSNPLSPYRDVGLTVNALWTDPEGAEGSWVELYSSAPKTIPLEGFRLETARDGEWRTVLAFPGGCSMPPGSTLLVGEKGVANADFHADLGFPAHWPATPACGVRLVWDGVACGNVADAVIVGRNHFPKKGGLDREGWDSDVGVRPKGNETIVRHYPGVDNNRSHDWTTRAGVVGRPAKIALDTDGDGLPDADEWSGRLNQPWGEPTNPYNPDSDGDGLGDREECCVHHTNPNTWASDGDIYPWTPQGTPVREWPGSDPYEIEHGWNPLVADENTNGIPDSWEMALGTDALLNGADSDGDGISDLEEMRTNRNPRPGGPSR